MQQYIRNLEELPSKKAFIVLGNNSQAQLKLISNLLKNNCQQISIKEHQKTICKHISLPQIIHIRYEKQNAPKPQEACIISIFHEKQVHNRAFNKILVNYLTKIFQTIHLVLVFQSYYDDVNRLNENITELVSFFRSNIQKFLQKKHEKCISAILMDPNLREDLSEIYQYSDSREIQKLIGNINKCTAYQFIQGYQEILFQQLIKSNQQMIKTSLLSNTVYLQKSMGQNLIDLIEIQLEQLVKCLRIYPKQQLMQLITSSLQKISNQYKLQLVINQLKEQLWDSLWKMKQNQINKTNSEKIDQILQYILFICRQVNIENTPDQKEILQILSQQFKIIREQLGTYTPEQIMSPTKSIKVQITTYSEDIMPVDMSIKQQKIYQICIPIPLNANKIKIQFGLSQMKFDIKKCNSLVQSFTPLIRNNENFQQILNLPNKILKFDLLHRCLTGYIYPLKNMQELKTILLLLSKILRLYKLFEDSIKILMVIPDFNGIQRDFESAAKIDIQAILNDQHQRCLSIQFVKILQTFCEQSSRPNIAGKCKNYLLQICKKQQKIGSFTMDNDREFMKEYKEKQITKRQMDFNYHPNINIKSDSFREQILKKVFLLEKSDFIDVVNYYAEK